MTKQGVGDQPGTDGGVARLDSGTRGGLGRILLTAFMLLGIVPLSVVSYLAITQVQRDMRRMAVHSLAQVASLQATQLHAWLQAQEYELSRLARDPTLQRAILGQEWEAICGTFRECGLGNCVLTLSLDEIGQEYVLCDRQRGATSTYLSFPALSVPVVSPTLHSIGSLTLQVDAAALSRLAASDLGDESIRFFLIDAHGSWFGLSNTDGLSPGPVEPRARGVSVEGVQGTANYVLATGQAMLGAYSVLPDWQIALWAEQPQEGGPSRGDDLAAMLIGSTLAVALLTAIVAAFVTRGLTRPIVRLTMSAVKIAGGDLGQTVELDRRDEIGVLSRAFNIMTAELRSLYAGLERKVDARTRQLTEANLELRYKEMQLKLSAEVGRVATAILDLDRLLRRVTELVLETYAHVYGVSYVAILLRDEASDRLARKVYCGRGGVHGVLRADVDDGSWFGQTIHRGMLSSRQLDERLVDVVIPLRIGARVIGALDLHCSKWDTLGADDIDVLQGLGDQISVAIQNAQLYAVESEAAERLGRLDDLRRASLGVGSRELATQLNTIIGFSRLMLNEADGPLTDLQRTDLVAIHKSGYELLGLIDNVLTLSELEGGSVELAPTSVDLGLLLSEVVATARQRLVDTTIEWQSKEVLPAVWGDASLLRQAFLGLVSATANQIPQRHLVMRASAYENGERRVIVQLAADGLMEANQVFNRDDRCLIDQDIQEGGVGVGLALAQQIIALHKGRTVYRFDAECGPRSAIMLPVGGDSLDEL